MKKEALYGQWPSTLSAAKVASAGVRISDLQVESGSVFWSERRPAEQGRNVIVRRNLRAGPEDSGIGKIDVVSRSRNVRSAAHEYGGACYLVLPGAPNESGPAQIAFTDYETRSIVLGRLDVHDPSNPETERVLLVDPTAAYADFAYDRPRRRLVCARESYSKSGPPVASLVALDLVDRQTTPALLLDSRDLDCNFLSNPRISPAGNQLAWVAWRHPNMPWDASELWLSDLSEDGQCTNPRQLAGGDCVSIFQPEWSPDGILHFVSDQSGWWNIYRLEQRADEAPGAATNLTPLHTEFGLPQWVFGMSTYKIPRPDLLVAIGSQNGLWNVGVLDPSAALPAWQAVLGPASVAETATNSSRRSKRSACPDITHCDSVAADADFVALTVAGPYIQPTVSSWHTQALSRPMEGGNPPLLIEQNRFTALEESSLAVGKPIVFSSPHPLATLGEEHPQHESHAFYYPPRNCDYRGVPGERPPLIVKSHGGPTAATNNALDPAIQFWTSRGYAVVDVNYAGSTGYGRAYRKLLDGKWGVVDVEDCAAAALHLADMGLVDAQRLIIRGGSAGGYTTLAALTFTDVFKAGASLYGIGDLEALVRDTHKFESRYLDRMIGPYPEAKPLYQQRSPIHSADRLSCPVIFFQGSEDKVVPPNQSEAMFEALEAKGLPTSYVLFEGEGHGFRRAENIVSALEKELAFYRLVLR